MNLDPKRILVISPHTDDAEVSSGGTISRFIREGRRVHILVLSRASAEETERPLNEYYQAMRVLGIPEEHYKFFDFPVRRLSESRQEILDLLIETKTRVNPDLVIIPSLNDIHQDHQVAAQESLRAFKNHASIICFTYPWNLLSFNTTCFIEFNEGDLDNKVKAISCYHSQDKPYMKPEVIRAWAITQGVVINAKYAEGFEVARLVV